MDDTIAPRMHGATSAPARLTVAMTHPVQYYSPWFRYIADNAPQIRLTAVYATVPTPEQQGVGFGVSFDWDTSLLDGYEYVQVRAARRGDYLHSDRFFGLSVRGMGDAVTATRPDIVLVPGWYSLTLVAVLATCRKLGIPTLYRGDTQLSSARDGLKSLLWEIKTRAVLRLFKSFLTVGKRNRDYLKHFGVPDSQIFFAPHCVDNDLFRNSSEAAHTSEGRARIRTSLGVPVDDFVVLFVGKLTQRKRPWDVVSAAARLGERVTTLIVGSGSEEGRCREEAAEHGSRVVFAGFINQSRLGEVYGAADVCVLPSATENETWGLVVNEALAAGTPCIVSDLVGCGPDLILPDVTGNTFRSGDVAGCATALLRIRDAVAHGHDFSSDCRQTVEGYSFRAATDGLIQAVDWVQRDRLRAIA
jgi:glycosyltransferase involved in cell wall biosynthesis